MLDDAKVERVVLAGHSMGVQVALETYRRHTGRVVGLALLCGAPSHPLRTFRGTATLEKVLPQVQRWILRAPRAVNRLKRMLVPTKLAFDIASRLEINASLIEPGDFMPYLEGLARIDVRLFVAMLAEAGRHSADDVLPTIDVPALVVAGDRDGFTPPDRSRAMAAAIPASELLIVEDGSHTAPIERPALVGEIVQRFLTTRVDPLFRQRNSALGRP